MQSLFNCGDQGGDTLRNWGMIDGEVDLGSGADVYNGRNGVVTEKLLGGEGDDRFIGNADEADSFDGGAGRDIIDFRQQGAVKVALDESFGNSGAALGDSYAQFDSIFGSLAGSDHLRGNSGVNSLFGYGGDDTLEGRAGDDTLRGGSGQDADDRFIFRTSDKRLWFDVDGNGTAEAVMVATCRPAPP